MAKKKVLKPYTGRGLAIIGPFGNIWGNNLFSNKSEALRHLTNFWTGVQSFDQTKWKVIQASAVVSADPDARPERIDG